MQGQSPLVVLRHPAALPLSLGKGLRVVPVALVVPVVPAVGAGLQVAVMSVVAALIGGETARNLGHPERPPGAHRRQPLPTSPETLDDKCERLQREWQKAELARLSQGYEAVGEVDQVAGAVVPLYYVTVSR